MRKDLVATFANSLGKEHNWTYKDLNPDLAAPAIKEACELLTSLDIFEQDGVKLFDSVLTAKTVLTIEKEIFDKEKKPGIEANICEESLAKKDAVEVPLSIEKQPATSRRTYDYLYSKSRTAIEEKLTVQANPINSSLSSKNEETKIEKRPFTNKENSATTPSESLPTKSEVHKPKKAKKGILAWLRRRKNHNKDDPEFHSDDSISSG